MTFSRTSSCGYVYRFYGNYFQRSPSSSKLMNANSIPSRTKKGLSKQIQKRSTHVDEVAIHENRVEFGQFVAREARLDEEYWTAAWLRAESHWENRENERYADNYKRKFREQAFNELKKRCRTQLGEKSTCIVNKGNENVSVVGTLDLSIRYLSHGQTFPGEQVKAPFLCLIDLRGSSRYGYIANLCVSKSARRQGIARSMLKLAIVSAKQEGAEQVYGHVHRRNTPAQGLYRNMGFEVIEAANSQLSGDETYLLRCDISNY